MTTCLGKSCSFGLTARAFRKLLSVYAFSYLPFGFEDRIWDLIVSVLDHCLFVCFVLSHNIISVLYGVEQYTLKFMYMYVQQVKDESNAALLIFLSSYHTVLTRLF